MNDEESTTRRSTETPQVPAPPAADACELSDEDLGKVSGGFSSVSNVLKTRHDTAKNSISNIR